MLIVNRELFSCEVVMREISEPEFNPAEISISFATLENSLRPKYGIRLFGSNGSDVSTFDKILLDWLKCHPEHFEKFRCFWFVAKKNEEAFAQFLEESPLKLKEKVQSHFATTQCEYQQMLEKLLQKLNPAYPKIKIHAASRSQHLFYKVAKRMAYMNPDYIYALAHAFSCPLKEEDLANYENSIKELGGLIKGDSPYLLIYRLHEMFADIEAYYYKDLFKEEMHHVFEISHYYLGKYHFGPDFTQSELQEKYQVKMTQGLTLAEDNFHSAVMTYIKSYITGGDDATKKARAELLALTEQNKKFSIEQLTHDLKVIRDKQVARKAEIEKQLAFLQSDINRLAQECHVGLAIKNKMILQPSSGFASEEERTNRTLHARAARFAQIASIMVAIGEGSVAAVAGATVIGCAPLAIALGVVTFICGAVANYYLIRSDAYNTILSFFMEVKVNDKNGTLVKVRAMYLDKDGNIVSIKTRVIINIFSICALSAGFVYGALAAMSMFKGVLLPFLLKVGTAKILAFALAGVLSAIPVVFLAIGMAAIFYAVINDFIKNKRWIGIASYFRDTYFPAYFSELTTLEKLAHVLVRVPFQLIKLSLCLSIVAIITVASLGVFHTRGVELLKLLMCPDKMATVFATVATVLNAAMSVIFGVDKIQGVFNLLSLRTLVKAICFIPLLVMPILFLSKPVLSWWHDKVASPVSKAIVRGKTFCELTPVEKSRFFKSESQRPNRLQEEYDSKAKRAKDVMRIAIACNGVGQGALMKANGLVTACAVVNSALPNAVAAYAEIETAKTLPLQRTTAQLV